MRDHRVQGAADREPLWYRFATRTVGPEVSHPEAATAPGRAVLGTSAPEVCAWPEPGAGALLHLAYPHGRGIGTADDVLATTFMTQRRDPAATFPDHRAYPSPRALFPLRCLLPAEGAVTALEPESFRSVTARCTGRPGGPVLALLTGRYDDIPAGYGWFRGSLLAIEAGVVLRQLAVSAELLGVRLSARLARPDWRDDEIWRALARPWAWSPPIEIHTPQGVAPDQAPAGPVTEPVTEPYPPPVETSAQLREVLRIYRSHAPGGDPFELTGALPAEPAPGGAAGLQWSDLLWRRSSGRAPRQIHGFRLGRGPLGRDAAEQVLAWDRTSGPPQSALAEVMHWQASHLVVRGVQGMADGHYEINERGLHLRRAGSWVLDELADAYTLPSVPRVACDLASAQMVWFRVNSPREAVDELGPAAWSQGLTAVGWWLHGLSLGAAAAGLVARTVRAFDERRAAELLGLTPQQQIAVAVIVGRDHPVGTPQLDLRP